MGWGRRERPCACPCVRERAHWQPARSASFRWVFNLRVAEDARAAPCACSWFHCAHKASRRLAAAQCVTYKANFACNGSFGRYLRARGPACRSGASIAGRQLSCMVSSAGQRLG